MQNDFDLLIIGGGINGAGIARDAAGDKEAQREAALERGDELTAEELDRDPELKLGPAANSMERRAKAMAARHGREYVPVAELQIRIAVLNRYTALGIPVTEPVG